MWTWVEMLSFCESLLCLDDRSEWDVLLCRKIKNSWLRTCYLYRSHFKYRPVIYFTIIGIIYKWKNWNNFLKMKILKLVIRAMRKGMKSIQILKQKNCNIAINEFKTSSKTRELKKRTWPWMTRFNSGIRNRYNFFVWAFVCFKKLNVLTLLRWSFWYIKLAVLIWFRLRNFNPRYFQFLVGFSFKTIFAPSPTTTTLKSKDVEFSFASFDICQKFVASCPLPKRPRKNLKMNFRFSLPRKWVRVWCHFKWFFMLYNLSYSDSSFVNSAPKSWKSGNSTYEWLNHGRQIKIIWNEFFVCSG